MLCLLPATPGEASAQQVNGRPRVFFDCDGPGCNSQYYRTEIDWVDWVNDPMVSDVHLIISSVQTGAGGREYLLDFAGRVSADGYLDAMLVQTLSTDTDRERLDALTNAISIGLARFGTVQGYSGLARVEGLAPAGVDPSERLVSPQEVNDPWNLWVFEIDVSGDLEGESNEEERRFFSRLEASRITPTWKFNLGTNFFYSEREFLLEGSTFTDSRYDWGFRPYLAYALSEHWSLGARAEVARVVRFNQSFRWEVTPALEYSVFPYEEATRRALTATYRIGPAYRAYLERTIFDEMYETRFEHALEIDLSQRQTWGEAGLSITGSQFIFLPNTEEYEEGLYNISLRGDLEVRIVRGLSVELDGNVEWVQDQLYLSAEGVSDEERLLRLQQQETSFRYRLSVGLSIQFGSIYNNVVNNRFNRAQGFGGFR